MKKILLALALALGSHVAVAEAPKEKTRVCVDVKDKEGRDVVDPKTKKVKQNCKEVKVHKKLEGHEVPVKK
jgi:hypothetical protein